MGKGRGRSLRAIRIVVVRSRGREGMRLRYRHRVCSYGDLLPFIISDSDIVLCILEGWIHSLCLILSGKDIRDMPRGSLHWPRCFFPFPSLSSSSPPPSLYLHESSVPPTQCFIFMIHDSLIFTLNVSSSKVLRLCNKRDGRFHSPTFQMKKQGCKTDSTACLLQSLSYARQALCCWLPTPIVFPSHFIRCSWMPGL